jgi:hypothetical protein
MNTLWIRHSSEYGDAELQPVCHDWLCTGASIRHPLMQRCPAVYKKSLAWNLSSSLY